MNTKLLITSAILSLSCLSFSQNGDGAQLPVNQSKVVRKIKIRHADPHLIMLLLAGRTNQNTPPEISTVQNKP